MNDVRAKTALSINIVGAGVHARWLAEHGALIPGIVLANWSPSPDDRDGSLAASVAGAAGVAFVPDWKALANDSSGAAVLILGDLNDCVPAIETALRAGKNVTGLTTGSLDARTLRSIRDAEVQGGGNFFSKARIAYTEAGSRALRLLRDGDLGRLHSIYLAVRTARSPGSAADFLTQAGVQAFDFVLSCVPGALQTMHSTGGALFDYSNTDTVVSILRFEPDIVVTVELSRCLPRTIPTGPDGQIEFELIGSQRLIRAEPENTAVVVFTDDKTIARPWLDHPLRQVLVELRASEGAKGNAAGDAARLERLAALMAAARQSLESGRAVQLSRN
jgi:predicted dehydrogenase